MSISDLVGNALDRPVTAIRRQVVSIVIAIAAGLGALFYGASAAMLALELLLGPILARVVIAVILLAIAVAGYFAPRLIGRSTASDPSAEAAADATAAETARLTRDQRIAMVFEALLLGFSLGSRKPAEKH
ncbi:hypothetical protein [Pseudorhodoplanes sinuspersici]|uniref:Uncharacterized protein n=1 Tax=Pseudorhodoplanes sinuspersici TaxID=1235591 RepID=A0A1W6ZQ86_9HYPH|nr:hypothetical protein [Pseudorhodoplanes sinuspersici]ARP99563.1 hypothetical protein CAK95_11065 [Pseudorhodoplanes sinuspersici]RKE70530.1 hypothetical protein DFP91_2762 [Pseudorhodoplanes sinuspersici]